MTAIEAISQRASIRKYQQRAVEKEKLKKLLEAARLAPSASNRQEWRFVVVNDKEIINKLVPACCNQSFIASAPLVIAACADTDNHKMRCGQLSYPIDVAIACEHIVLAAVELGLGSCWIGAFYEEEVKEILNIPDHIRVVELLTLGYSAESPKSKVRLDLSEIAFENSWQKPLYLK